MRPSGRDPTEMRAVTIERNVALKAEGSCLISFGNTKVFVTASVETTLPSWRRNSGLGWVTAEYGMLPRATGSRTKREAAQGKQSGRTQEIQRLIGRSLRAVVDLNALGERTVTLDCDALQADGGTRTAAITGACVALILALRQMVQYGVLKTLPIRDYVVATSVGILKGEPLMDLCYDEDSRADVDMNVVCTGDGRFIELQGTAEREPFTRAQMDDLVALATRGIEALIAHQKKVIAQIQ